MVDDKNKNNDNVMEDIDTGSHHFFAPTFFKNQDFTFHLSGRRVVLDPKEDLTAYELYQIKCVENLARINMGGANTSRELWKEVEKHNLTRHFKFI